MRLSAERLKAPDLLAVTEYREPTSTAGRGILAVLPAFKILYGHYLSHDVPFAPRIASREALMTATQSTVRHGFELLREQNLAEINSEARYYRHLKTGAELLSLVNGDENKVFGV